MVPAFSRGKIEVDVTTEKYSHLLVVHLSPPELFQNLCLRSFRDVGESFLLKIEVILVSVTYNKVY